MNTDKKSGSRRRLLTVIIPVIILFLPLCYSIVYYAVAKPPEKTLELIDRSNDKYDQCVRDTDYMRYHHWELLHQVREEVVRHGMRTELSFDKCRQCHTSREQFCNRCHESVNLTPDCFNCHYYPDNPQPGDDTFEMNQTKPGSGYAVDEKETLE